MLPIKTRSPHAPGAIPAARIDDLISLLDLDAFLGIVAWGRTALHAQSWFDVKLWEQGLPNTNGRDGGPERQQDGIYTPEIRVFLPDSAKATGRIILACPGGGYSFIALGHEGYDWAPYFNEMGIAYAVLKYRLPFGHPEVPVSDAQ